MYYIYIWVYSFVKDVFGSNYTMTALPKIFPIKVS